MRSIVQLSIVVGCLCTSVMAIAEEARAEEIHGKWFTQKVIDKGNEVAKAVGGTWTFEAERVAAQMPNRGRRVDYAYKLDSEATPKAIDLTFDGTTEKMLGLYEIKEGRLRLCFGSPPGSERPKDFRAGKDRTLIMLTRDEVQPVDAPPVGDMEKFEPKAEQLVPEPKEVVSIVVPKGEGTPPLRVRDGEVVRLTCEELRYWGSLARLAIDGPAELVRQTIRVERKPGEEISKPQELTQIQRGQILHMQRGCAQCHTTDGKRKVGPPHDQTFGNEQRFVGGNSLVADEAYIKDSILNPQAKVREGFPPAMPTFKGLLTGEELDALAAYIKSFHPEHQTDERLDLETVEPRQVEFEIRPTGTGLVTATIYFASHPTGKMKTKTYQIVVE